MRGDRLPGLGAVEHGQVRALAGRRHQVRGVTEERHPGHDDRAQFLAGIDLILAGIGTVR